MICKKKMSEMQKKVLFEEIGTNIFNFKKKNCVGPVNSRSGLLKCSINMDVVLIPYKDSKSWYYDITFSTKYKNKKNGANRLHPLYLRSVQEDDNSIFEGMCVVKNPITEIMIGALLKYKEENENDIGGYDIGHRPALQYCGEIMRALLEFEA